jgi:hypothetical protein
MPSSSSSSSAASPAPPVADASGSRVQDTLARFFGGFVDGTDFAFLRATCTPQMSRFISLHDVDVESASRASRAFFKGIHGVKYEPELKALRVEALAAGARVYVPVRMRWSRPADPKQFGIEEGAMAGWGPPTIERDVTANVELVLDAAGRIASYVEASVRTPPLRVTAGEECDSKLPRGTIVHDLGETIITEVISTGPATTLRKVQANGEQVWMVTERHFWRTSAQDKAWIICLEPVGEAGR